MAISRDEIVSEIRKYVASNSGEIPGERSFAVSTRIRESAWKGKYWARWTDAVREAGYTPNLMNQKIAEENILSKAAEFVRELGYFPVRDEINLRARTHSDFPVWHTIKKRYGGMPQFAAALLEFSKRFKDEALSKICEQRMSRETVKPSSDRTPIAPPAKVGFVYLKYSPSLRLYKIGKADDAERRGAGISLLLPEDLVPKHEIKTDCPYILEKYFEKRFRAKKKKGEWYDLRAEDIEVFKKRRDFMFCEFF